MPLPVIFSSKDEIKNIVEKLKLGYFEMHNEHASNEIINSWYYSLKEIKAVCGNYPVIAEFPLFGLERIDFIVVGRRKALIIETKGWEKVHKIDDLRVKINEEYRQEPCYQLNNYIWKLKLFHSSSQVFEFSGVVYLYNLKEPYNDSCLIIKSRQELAEQISKLDEPASENEIKIITEGRFIITKDLIDFIRTKKEDLLKKASYTLLSSGFGLSEDQALIISEVLSALKNNERKIFIIKGESGSGKSLLAFTLLLEAISKGYKALLGYKNNRLINTLRKAFPQLSQLIQFYSTGPRGHYSGIGEKNFTLDKYGKLDLVIYDEAQRMSEDVIAISMKRGKVCVYLYDEAQVLIGDECGNREMFLKYAEDKAVERTLRGSMRIQLSYLNFVKDLLYGRQIKPFFNYEFKIFLNIKDLLCELENKMKNNFKVALVASFTESEGDKKNKFSIKNVRVGYPLQSGFDLYKNLDIKIYWLMDEKIEYPSYWMNRLSNHLQYCASVYGSQGFEAAYVGVIWGRDLIIRNGSWEVNADVITDDIGKPQSLKRIAKSNKAKALELLRNRYYILLTRGIRGTYVFFEDEQTRDYILNLLSNLATLS
jgi:DUF2075 family protein/DNA replication protein DnaC